MIEISTSGNFIVAGTAVISVGIGIFVKIASRNDQHASFSRNDFAVGLDLLISAIIILVSRSETISPWILLYVFIGLWGTSLLIRKWGWEDENQLKIGIGVIVPDVIGAIVLLAIGYFVN